MVSILFFIKRKKLLKDGTASIFARVTFNRLSAEVATGKSVVPTQWVATKGRAKGNTLVNKQVNSFLDQMEYTLHDLTLQIQREGKQVSAKEILNRYKHLNAPKPKTGILALYAEHNQELEELVSISVALATYKRHETSLKLFHEFLLYRYQVEDLAVSEIDVEILQKYQHYLMTVRHNNNNTTVKYIRNLGKILNLAVSRKLITASPIEELKLKIEPVDKGFLTQEELTKLADKDFSIVRLEQVRDVFLFCCYTGLSYVDVKRLYPSHIGTTADGRKYIRINRKKTDVESFIPLHPVAEQILSLYNTTDDSRPIFPLPKRDMLWYCIHEIGIVAGVKENLSYHASRHSFGTLTLSAGVPIESISKMMGHTNIRTTQGYAKVTDDKISKDMDRLVERRNATGGNSPVEK